MRKATEVTLNSLTLDIHDPSSVGTNRTPACAADRVATSR